MQTHKWKTVQMDELPKCNFCEEQAEFDDKTKMGSWAYMCRKHEIQYGVGIGTKLEKRVKIDAGKTDEIPTVTVPLTLDSVATVTCPHCGESRSVEPDANYVVTCESCENKYRVVSLI